MVLNKETFFQLYFTASFDIKKYTVLIIRPLNKTIAALLFLTWKSEPLNLENIFSWKWLE